MSLFGRDQPSAARSAAEREHARRVREARRRGLPDPTPPWVQDGAEPVEPAAEPVPVDPEPVAVDPVPAEPPPAPEAPTRPEPEVWLEPDPDPEPVAAQEPEPVAAAEPGLETHVAPRTPPPLPAREARRRPPRAPRAPRRGRVGTGESPALTLPRARQGRVGLGRIGALVALVGIVAVLWFLFSLFQPFKGDGHGRVVVQIPPGASARKVGDLLAKRGVVDSGFFFNLRAAIAGKRGDIKAGQYVLRKDMSYSSAIDDLTKTKPGVPTVDITIPEGRSRREEAPKLRAAGVQGSYLAATASSPLLHPSFYGAPRATRMLEGFLFPATYSLPRSAPTATGLVARQLKAFKRNFRGVSLKSAHRKHLTAYDVLIIASMVESEAQAPKDRPLIAAVIYNRLHQHIPLGIDATVRYALNQYSRPLTVSELNVNSPYNTRKRQRLPPTPISSPGIASIRAAAHPARVPYLFFVVKPGTCGEHAFSSTNAQFQRDVARYNSARARRGGKSPTNC